MLKYTAVNHNPFEETEIVKIALTNDSQKEIWLSCLIGSQGASLAYNESISLAFQGKLDRSVFIQAIQVLVARHEALRSLLSTNGETLLISKEVPATLNEIDLSLLSMEDQSVQIKGFIKDQMNQPFDLYQGPLFRFYLHKLNPVHHYFTLVVHHIIADGWSLGVMIDDLSKIYNTAISNNANPLPPPAQISDYSRLEKEYKETTAFQTTKEYWSRKFRNGVPSFNLPIVFARTNPRTYKGNRLDFPVPNDILPKLITIAHQSQVSLVITFLCAFELFLKRRAGQGEVIVGLPVAGQLITDNPGLVGHCVNLLPIQSCLLEKESYFDYLTRRKKEILDDLDHQRITFSEIIKDMRVSRDKTKVPLVPIVFNVDMGMDSGVTFQDLEHRLISNPREYENFDIFLNLSGDSNEVTCEWSFNTDIFDDEIIKDFHAGYMEIINSMIHEHHETMDLLSPKRESLSITKNGYKSLSSVADLIHSFETAIEKYASNVAIRFEGESLNYVELNGKINQLASYLLSCNIKQGDKVALSTDRSIEMLISMMALIKIGVIFVPIESSYPPDRKELILKNIDPKLSITSKKHSIKRMDGAVRPNTQFIEDLLLLSQQFSSHNLSIPLPYDRPIYILHTSGSTGVPKGVSMNQRALANIFNWQVNHSVGTMESNTLQFSPLNFDVSFQEIFSTFFTGGTLVLVSNETRLDPSRLIPYLKEHTINRLFLPFVALQSLVEFSTSQNQFPSHLVEVITAGEQLKITPQIVQFFSTLPNCLLYNHYGPTETHIVTSLKLNGNPKEWPALPSIGKEIDQTEIFILDEQMHLVSEGEIGELCISGICLADGYVNQPTLTSSSFPTWNHPQKGKIRIYKSGDLGRRLQNGEIEFLGRIDHQIKLRGFRIELSEIEYYLNQENDIRQSVVIAKENDDSTNTRLIGYVTVDSNILTSDKDGIASWKERWDLLYNNAQEEQLQNKDESLDNLVFKQLGHFENADKHAQEWLNQTVDRIQEIIDKNLNKNSLKILEVGCGGGQLMYQLVDNCTSYFASDYSETAIHNIRKHINRYPYQWNNIILATADAKDFSFLNQEKVDLVIINSVVQYFPNEQYLLELIEKSLQVLNPEGCIFLGDIQARETLAMCLAAEQLHHSKDETILGDFNTIIANRIAMEDELVIDPVFFYSLQKEIPEISHVDVQIRKGTFLNETTKYHYDAWIYKDPSIVFAQPDHVIDWNKIDSLHLLQQKLASAPHESFQIQNIANGRCVLDVALHKSMQSLPINTPLSVVKATIKAQVNKAENPEDFWKIGKQLGFDTYVRWMNSGIDNQLEVIYIPSNAYLKTCPPLSISSKNQITFSKETELVKIIQTDYLDEQCNLWRNNLRKKLPDYMIPDQLVVLNKLPLTSTGKIDRKSLPGTHHMTTSEASILSLPENDIEIFLTTLWSRLLSVKQIDRTADFFDIGGHSLLAVKVIIAIEKEYGVKLPLATLFDHSSIQQLAVKIKNESKKETKKDEDWNALVPIKRTGSNPPVYMVHGAGLNVLVFKSFARYVNPEQPVFGIQALGQNGQTQLHDDIHEIARKYNEDILKNDPVGPYLLGGYSYGGFLAYEMARQLKAMGKEVKMLAIFDTYVDEFDTTMASAKNIGKYIKFIATAIVKNPVRYFSHCFMLAKLKLKYSFSGNHIKQVETYSYNDDIVKAYKKAFKNYKMIPQHIDISLFRAKHPLQYYEDSTTMGWKNFADNVIIYDIPGDHKTIFYPPNDKGLAAVFQAAIQETIQ